MDSKSSAGRSSKFFLGGGGGGGGGGAPAACDISVGVGLLLRLYGDREQPAVYEAGEEPREDSNNADVGGGRSEGLGKDVKEVRIENWSC